MAKTPAMTPTPTPLADVLDRATGARRAEVDELVTLHRDLSGAEPVVWAGRILGFGAVEYRYDSGRSGTVPLLAFAPGPKHHTVYLASGFAERWPDLLGQLGPHRASTACLYLTRLEAVDRSVLRELLVRTRDDALANG